MSQVPDYFKGKERIGRWLLTWRSMRKGSPDELAVGDLPRVIECARTGAVAQAKRYLEIMHANNLMIIEATYEWTLQLNASIREQCGIASVTVSERAYAIWQRLVAGSGRRASAALAERLAPAWLDAHLGEELAKKRSRNLRIPSPAITGQLEALYARAVEPLNGGKGALAMSAIHLYHAAAVHLHDLLIDYVSGFCSAVSEFAGETVADQVLDTAFRNVPTVGTLWAALPALKPSDLAFALAEHLRAHFSGRERAGAVKIIDEPDRYRLVFAPCGSGGSLRRRLAANVQAAASVCKNPSNSSWNQAGVPYYCTHCAHNEIHSIEIVGYPRWVTEFTPNPNSLCGWTIYKDPANIPELYFSRLGRKKDPSKFKRTGGLIGLTRAFVALIQLVSARRTPFSRHTANSGPKSLAS